MATYIQYDLEDGSTILIEAPDEYSDDGLIPAARGGKNRFLPSKKKFQQAFEEAKHHALILLKELDTIPVEEAEIKFGLTTIGEAGNFAIGKIGLSVNYEITLKWKKPTSE